VAKSIVVEILTSELKAKKTFNRGEWQSATLAKSIETERITIQK
jgi:hypothetical protein